LNIPRWVDTAISALCLLIIVVWASNLVRATEHRLLFANEEVTRLKWQVDAQANELNRLENRMRVAGLRVR